MRTDPPAILRDDLQLQDFHKHSKQIEREQESKKLALLMERVKRQLAERQGAPGPRIA